MKTKANAIVAVKFHYVKSCTFNYPMQNKIILIKLSPKELKYSIYPPHIVMHIILKPLTNTTSNVA